MFKSKLQEYCQQKKWNLPAYGTRKEGPDHCPLFKASVIVNGSVFQTICPCNSSKKAQDSVAQIAYAHFAGSSIGNTVQAGSEQKERQSSSIGITVQAGFEQKEQQSSSIGNTVQAGSEQKEQQNNSLYKNRLQEFTQRKQIKFPVYRTVNEAGPQDFAKFRSTVEVDGETYSCLNTFSSIRAAEKDVAKIAVKGIYKKIQKTTEEGFSPILQILQDKIFCKSILREFAAKMNMENPKYDTAKVEGLIPVFTSCLVFNGMNYSGGPSVSKNEAEQFAACAAISSILVNSELGMHLLEMVKSKGEFYSAMHDHIFGDTDASLYSGTPVDQASNLFTNVVSEVHQGKSHVQPTHEFRNLGIETISQAAPLPIAFVPSTQAENHVVASISGKKKKCKRTSRRRG